MTPGPVGSRHNVDYDGDKTGGRLLRQSKLNGWGIEASRMIEDSFSQALRRGDRDDGSSRHERPITPPENVSPDLGLSDKKLSEGAVRLETGQQESDMRNLIAEPRDPSSRTTHMTPQAGKTEKNTCGDIRLVPPHGKAGAAGIQPVRIDQTHSGCPVAVEKGAYQFGEDPDSGLREQVFRGHIMQQVESDTRQ